MKKSLIALAVIAASGAAMAQSSVTLYGLIDVSLQNYKAPTLASGATPTTFTSTSLSQNRMASGLQNGSRWGMKGSEDLGGGLNAVFDLQSGYNIDTGSSAQGGLLFGRHAFVGFSGGFGTLTFGRHDTSLDDAIGDFLPSAHNGADATSGPGLTAANAAALAAYNSAAVKTTALQTAYVAALNGSSSFAGNVGAWVGYNSRVDNSIKFQTNNYSGFRVSAVYGLGENKTATVGATSTVSIAGRYDNGPVGVLLAYQDEGLAKSATGDTNLKNTLVGGYYDFGVAKIYADYNIAKLDVATVSLKNKEFAVGVSAPVGALTLRAEYAQSKGDILAMDNKSKGFDLEALYDLSKRTTLYTSYVSTKHTQMVDSTTSLFAVGVRHKF